MKRIMLFLCTLVLLIGTHDVAVATLTQMTDIYGDLVVYEDTGGQYWYPDLGYSRNMYFNEQMSAIDDLNDSNYYGLDTWHLASRPEFNNLLASMDIYDSDVDMNFLPTITSLNPHNRTYSGIIDEIVVHTPTATEPGYIDHAVETFSVTGSHRPDPHVLYVTSGMPDYKRDDRRVFWVGAWITASGTPTWPGSGTDPLPVPEPGTMILLCSGIVGLVGFRKKFKK